MGVILNPVQHWDAKSEDASGLQYAMALLHEPQTIWCRNMLDDVFRKHKIRYAISVWKWLSDVAVSVVVLEVGQVVAAAAKLDVHRRIVGLCLRNQSFASFLLWRLAL